MKRFFGYIILMALALSVSAHEQYISRHYSIKDGMSQNTVMAILQDRQGFMWFGTWDGLNRFDGYSFKVYKAMSDGVAAHVNNRVDCIYEDEEEQLWWATYDGHYYRLDATRQTTTEQRREDLPEQMVAQMEQAHVTTQIDSHGIIWQADETYGILRYRAGQWKRFTPALDTRYAGRLREHFFLLEDHQGRTWVNPTGGGWSYYDYDKDELVYPIKGLTNMIHTAYIDREGQMWIATYDGGVDCVNMEPAPYRLVDMRHSERDNGEVRAFAQKQNGEVLTLLKSQTGVYCALDTRHGLLYGTKGAGLKDMTHHRIIPTSHPDIYDIEEGEDGTLYVATYGGGVNVIRWDEARKAWSQPQVFGPEMKVRDIEVLGSTLWCGTTTGIMYINLLTEETTLIPSYDIRAIRHSHGRLWIGSFGGGLMTIDPNDSTWEIIRVETYHDIILSMTSDSAGIWFCSENDIAQLNIETVDLY